MGVCARSGLPDRAADIYAQMGAQGVVPNEDVFNSLIDAYGKAVQMPRAVAVLNEMRKSKVQPSQLTYATIIRAAGQAGDTENALQLFLQVIAHALSKCPDLCPGMVYGYRTDNKKIRK